jgi:hypothetical protein
VVSQRARDMSGSDLQDCHEDGKPELLRTEEAVGVAPPLAALDVVGVSHDHEYPGHLRRVSENVGLVVGWVIYGKAQPSYESVMLLEDIMVGAEQRVSRWYCGLGSSITDLRTQGKALSTEMMMKTFVMMPLAITAGCCTARYRMMSTIL